MLALAAVSALCWYLTLCLHSINFRGNLWRGMANLWCKIANDNELLGMGLAGEICAHGQTTAKPLVPGPS